MGYDILLAETLTNSGGVRGSANDEQGGIDHDLETTLVSDCRSCTLTHLSPPTLTNQLLKRQH